MSGLGYRGLTPPSAVRVADHCVSVRDGNVLLGPSIPHYDDLRCPKYVRLDTHIKDDEGNTAFFLVDKHTSFILENTLGQSKTMKLVPFKLEHLDESLLWIETGDVGEGFCCIRALNKTRLDSGDKGHGGVYDGTTVVLGEGGKGYYQSWNIRLWGREAYDNDLLGGGYVGSTVRVFCKADEGFSATVRNGTVVLAPSNPQDEYQHWIKDMRHSNFLRDEEGYPSFALVNQVTGEAIKHSQGEGQPVKLVPYNPAYREESVLWTEGRDVGGGFRRIRMVNNTRLGFGLKVDDMDHGGVQDGTIVVLWEARPQGDKVAGEASKHPRRGHYCHDSFLKRLADLVQLN